MTDCHYCTQIHAIDPGHPLRPAQYDVGSDCPRCTLHWRYVCQCCGKASHWHGTFFCPDVKQFVCHHCAVRTSETLADFWCWEYYFAYQCPICNGMHSGLDYAEFASQHPYQLYPDWETMRQGLSPEPLLPRAIHSMPTITSPNVLSDTDIATCWDAKAERWDSSYDEEGDRNRKYQSDEVLFRLLAQVAGQRILDAGCGQGYLCRILTKRGATVVGVENSTRFYELAVNYEEKESLNITYHLGSICHMPYLADGSFDAVVSNYVLMDVCDYEAAVRELGRVLKLGGVAVVVITHPCFHTPGSGWLRVPPDSLRREERVRWMVDRYFDRGFWRQNWPPFDTEFINFHRTLSDYFHTFQAASLRVTDLEEPFVTTRGGLELAPHYIQHLTRIPYSVAFRLERV